MTSDLIGPPPMVDVVPYEAARALIEEIRESLAALERDLDVALAQAEEAEAAAEAEQAGGRGVAAMEDLRRIADRLRVDAEAYASRVSEAAQVQARSVLETARRPEPPVGTASVAVLRLAPDLAPDAS